MSTKVDSYVILQGYNWNSWRNHNKTFFKYLASKSGDIKKVGIDAIWLPPCYKSVSPQGYMPLNLYDLNSEYGCEDDLKKCINLFNEIDIDVYADVVINHRCAEFQNKDGIYNVYGGKLCWNDSAIVSNDVMFQGKGNHSNFTLFQGAPNIDHSQEFVRKDLIEWMMWLKNDVGFNGFRFDFMTGIDPIHMREYFEVLAPDVCIGEFWDSMEYDNGYLLHNQNAHRQRIVDWIDMSGQTAYAFDMTTKGVLQEALRSNEYWRLADVHNNPPGLIGWWKQKSITFLDNHDTHYNSQNLWPFPYDRIVDGYVYLLTHPGIPMVYWDDFLSDDLNDTITRLTQIRKLFNINMNSSVNILNADNKEYCVSVDDRIQVIISHKLDDTSLQSRIKEKYVLFRSNNCVIHSLE